MNEDIKITVAFKVTYTVSPAEAIKSYGTSDPAEMAEIDADNYRDMPEMLAELLTDNAHEIVVTGEASR